jgi:hypothetical protein
MAAEIFKNFKEDKVFWSGKLDLSLFHEHGILFSPAPVMPKEFGIPIGCFPDMFGFIQNTSESFVLGEPAIVGDTIIITVYQHMAGEGIVPWTNWLTGIAEFQMRLKDGLIVEIQEDYVGYSSGTPGQRKSVNFMLAIVLKSVATPRRPDPYKTCLKLTTNDPNTSPCPKKDSGATTA